MRSSAKSILSARLSACASSIPTLAPTNGCSRVFEDHALSGADRLVARIAFDIDKADGDTRLAGTSRGSQRRTTSAEGWERATETRNHIIVTTPMRPEGASLRTDDRDAYRGRGMIVRRHHERHARRLYKTSARPCRRPVDHGATWPARRRGLLNARIQFLRPDDRLTSNLSRRNDLARELGITKSAAGVARSGAAGSITSDAALTSRTIRPPTCRISWRPR